MTTKKAKKKPTPKKKSTTKKKAKTKKKVGAKKKTSPRKPKTPQKNEQKLTSKQLKFVELIIKGTSQSDAYRLAYDSHNMGNPSIAVEACKLMKNPKISLRIEQAQKQILDNVMCSQEWVVHRLMVEAQHRGSDSLHSARVSALKTLSDYTGGFDKNRQGIDLTIADDLTPWGEIEAHEDG